jgi:hypothetical protein
MRADVGFMRLIICRRRSTELIAVHGRTGFRFDGRRCAVRSAVLSCWFNVASLLYAPAQSTDFLSSMRPPVVNALY